MSTDNRKPLFHLYFDDSGTRNPDRLPPTSPVGDWFALGGVLLKAEDEQLCRDKHASFCEKWEITYPLHSVKIRHKSDQFAWLASVPQRDMRLFYSDLDEMLLSIPVVGHACVIDRPGYEARYREKYGRRQWHLCKTACSVLFERVAKFAMKEDRRVRIWAEETDKGADKRIVSYFNELRTDGLPFQKDSMAKYGPMEPEQIRHRLMDLKFKRKSSPMAQIADLYLYPMCRAGYDELYPPLKSLRGNRKLINHCLSEDEKGILGIKYSCFDT